MFQCPMSGQQLTYSFLYVLGRNRCVWPKAALCLTYLSVELNLAKSANFNMQMNRYFGCLLCVIADHCVCELVATLNLQISQ